MGKARHWCFAIAVCAASIAARARADEAPTVYSKYEVQTIREALTRLRTTIDDDPSGKIIERIDVIPLDVIEPRDPAPNFLNWFHTRTKPHIIAQEVLQKPGDPFDGDLLHETCRNLRSQVQQSLVLCLPVRGSRP